MKLNIRAFSFTCGLMAGVGMFVLTWWMISFGNVWGETNIISQIYPGYTVSPAGSMIGMVWGFIDGLIGGAIFAWLYNLLSRKAVGGIQITEQRERENEKAGIVR